MALSKAVEQKELTTAGELLQLLESQQRYELVRGELLEMTPPGGLHGFVAVEIGALLHQAVKAKRLGSVMVETGYRLATDPDTVRSPDVSFLAADKIPPTGLPEGFISGPPDLAVEIVSPNDTATEIQAKVQDYLTHGAQLVWVIYPQQRLVVVYRPDGTAKTVHEADTLTAAPLIPDFSCQVAQIFS